MLPFRYLIAFGLLVHSASVVCAQDLVEFLSGAKITGKVLLIDKAGKKVEFESRLGTRVSTRTFRYSQIHAITYRGKRYVLNKKSASTPTGKATRSPAEIDRLIAEVGAAPPDWLETTRLNAPKSLDLSWPLKPPTKGWNQNKNVGQFFWSVVNPNPGRWKEGVKLVHAIMPRHQNNAALLQRDRKKLGEIYFELFQDYPRAAYWFRQANISKTEPANVMLAECYWRLGSKQMALQQLKSRSVTINAIKLYGDMGETQTALQLADQAAKFQPHQAYLLAGDACRTARQFDKALAYYNKALTAGKHRNAQYERRFNARANQSIEAIRLYEQLDLKNIPDGTYSADSFGYEGPVEVRVTIAAGKIESLRVTKHREKQFYAALTDTPNKILQKQSVQGIDAATGATITSEAIISATARALSKGAK